MSVIDRSKMQVLFSEMELFNNSTITLEEFKFSKTSTIIYFRNMGTPLSSEDYTINLQIIIIQLRILR